VFFYPSASQNHKFSEEDELPFDRIEPKALIEVDFNRILMFPYDREKGEIRECYMMLCNEGGMIIK
jgi:hypothetical protein